LKLQRDNINHDRTVIPYVLSENIRQMGALLPLLIIECNILTKFDWIQTVLKKIYGRICESLKFCEPTNGVAASGKHQFIQDEFHRSQHVEDPRRDCIADFSGSTTLVRHLKSTAQPNRKQ